MSHSTQQVVPAPTDGGGRDTGPRPSRFLLSVSLLIVAVVLLTTSIIALTRSHHPVSRAASGPHAAAASSAAGVETPSADPLTRMIAGYQSRLRSESNDWQTWGNLALAYVQQARVTVNPAYYPKASGAWRRSMQLHPHGNFIALAARGALEAARHDFSAALRDTSAASRLDPYNVTILAALTDAQTQLGRYGDARHTIARMMRVRPGTPAYARLSYADELAGHVGAARQAMRRALSDTSAPADRAFAYYYLGELELNHGNPTTALRRYRRGLQGAPTDTSCLEGVAKAEAAMGRNAAAIRDFTAVVNRVPQPQYVLEFGEFLQSLGRMAQAERQYTTFRTELRLFRANGVRTDLEPAQFFADHGRPDRALRYARQGVSTRPFLEMQDALAWALHRTGRDPAALRTEALAMRPGMRNALLFFHRGMIEKSLGRKSAARRDLATALAINPQFNPLQAPVARHALISLGGAT